MKYWKIQNEAGKDAELLIYGEIADEESWRRNNLTAPKPVADFISSLNGEPLTIRINSGGGSVFAAHAIHTLIRTYAGKTTAIIDGIAASAATIIAMAADTVIMPKNAMMMIHDPMIQLNGAMNTEELTKCIEALRPIKDSIIAAYTKRSKVSAEDLRVMMSHTTWMTAEECVEKGFADKIMGEVHPVLDGHYVVVNQIRHAVRDEDVAQLKDKIGGKTMEKDTGFNKEAESVFKKIANAMGFNVTKQLEGQIATNPPVDMGAGIVDEEKLRVITTTRQTAEDAVKAERQRMLDLDALNDGTETVKEIVDYAKQNGKTVDDIREIIDIVQRKKPDKATNFVKDMVQDNKDSGVDKVNGEPGLGLSEAETDAMRTERMANMLKKLY